MMSKAKDFLKACLFTTKESIKW